MKKILFIISCKNDIIAHKNEFVNTIFKATCRKIILYSFFLIVVGPMLQIMFLIQFIYGCLLEIKIFYSFSIVACEKYIFSFECLH